jgi:PKD repeat protein
MKAIRVFLLIFLLFGCGLHFAKGQLTLQPSVNNPTPGTSVTYSVRWPGSSCTPALVNWSWSVTLNGNPISPTSTASDRVTIYWPYTGVASVYFSSVTGSNPGCGYGSFNTNSASLSVTINFPPPPAPVVLPATLESGSCFIANWQASSGATGYRLDVSNDNFTTFVNGIQNATVDVNSISIGGLAAGTYQYRVRAVNSAGAVSSNSQVFSFIVVCSGTPSSQFVDYDRLAGWSDSYCDSGTDIVTDVVVGNGAIVQSISGRRDGSQPSNNSQPAVVDIVWKQPFLAGYINVRVDQIRHTYDGWFGCDDDRSTLYYYDIYYVNCSSCTNSGGPLTASISKSNDNTCGFQFGLSATFPNSNCQPISYLWDFGDGQTSTESAPFHDYQSVGTYNVKLTFKSKCTGSVLVAETTVTSVVTVSCIGPLSSNIYQSSDYGCGTQFRLFANFGKRDCRPTDYQWNFGDGQTSTESAPFHTYSGVGTYTVTLKYKFSCNAPSLVNEVTVTRQVTVTSALSSKLDFTIQNSLCGTTFTALPTFPDNTCSNVAYEWDFGDNTPKSTSPSPSHLYARGGSFNVSLKLTYSCSGCQKFITYNKNVIVPEPPPIASFTQQINSCTATFNSVFFQSPSCTIQTYNWDFGDGATSTVANPAHTYASAGTYSTSLAVAYTCGSTCSGQVIITKPTIIVAPEAPTVDFTTQKYACEINFTPSITHKNTACSTVSYLWNFGDGTTSVESNPAHLYAGAGTYSASLTVTYQCVNTCPAQASVTVSKTIILDAPPTATVDFNFSNYYCATKFSPATNYSSNTCRSVSYLWNFGDGATSNDRSPLHAYANPGSYNVSLKLFYQCNNGCPAEISVSKQITYTSSPAQLQDMLIQVETDVKKQVITASAVTFSDVWPLSHDNAALGNRSSYLNGTQGVWRNNASYAYDTARLQSPTINVAKDGTFPMNQFDWGSANFNVVPNWIQANTMTQYSPYSYELENQDVLGVYSAALYDYGGHLPSANGVNMRNSEMAFTSFESVDVDINGNPTGKPSGNWMLRNIDQPATNIYKVPIGLANAAVIEASVEELEFVQRVDVSAETLNFLFPSFFNAYFLPYAKSFNHLQDVEVLCKQVHPTNPKWSIIVLAKAPFEGFWSGKITVKRTARKAVDAVLGTVAHSGKKSLKVTSIQPPDQLNFRQEMLQLEQGKTYWVNVWVSVDNANLSTPKLADNLGIELTFLNRQQQPISTVSFQPVGTIIEGWQQIKGTFISPTKNPLIEIKFKPGSTGTAYYDDLRLQPEKGNMKAYVYDLNDYRLRAILDEENYASFFYYDAEGNLYLTKKETEKGIKTITENVSYQVERR